MQILALQLEDHRRRHEQATLNEDSCKKLLKGLRNRLPKLVRVVKRRDVLIMPNLLLGEDISPATKPPSTSRAIVPVIGPSHNCPCMSTCSRNFQLWQCNEGVLFIANARLRLYKFDQIAPRVFRLFHLLAEESFEGVHDQVSKSISYLLALLALLDRNFPIFVKTFEDMVILLSDLDFLHQCSAATDGHVCVQCFELLLGELASAEASIESAQRKSKEEYVADIYTIVFAYCRNKNGAHQCVKCRPTLRTAGNRNSQPSFSFFHSLKHRKAPSTYVVHVWCTSRSYF
jgi:hypothetical protein